MPDNVQDIAALTAQLVAHGSQETQKLDRLKRDVLDAINSGEYRVNRREVPFISSQTPRSVPAWAAGQRVEKTLGPFKDALGKLFWFDFYRIKRQVKIARKVASNVFLSVPVDDILRAHRTQQSLKLSAGSVWFIANQIEPGAPTGSFTGLTIRSGEIFVQGTFTIVGDVVTVGENDVCQLKLDLAQPSVTADSNSTYGQRCQTYGPRAAGKGGRKLLARQSCSFHRVNDDGHAVRKQLQAEAGRQANSI